MGWLSSLRLRALGHPVISATTDDIVHQIDFL